MIRVVKSSRASEADLSAAGIIAFVATNTGVVPERVGGRRCAVLV